MKAKRLVLDEVLEERWNQDAQWGGQDHDDEHDRGDWQVFIRKQLDKANRAGGPGSKNGAQWRERLIKIAALAIAAVESDDRKAAKP